MTGLFDVLSRYQFLLPELRDIIQIVLVAIGIFYILQLLARTRAMQMLFGLLLLAAIYFASEFLGLNLLGTILEAGFQWGVIAAVVVFQPELRSALARLGQSRMLRLFNKMEESQVVEELVEGVDRLSRAKIGGIIAIQREVGLDEYADTGTRIQARVSSDIIVSIFAPYGPLHDGAVLVSGDTLIAAGVILPLTQFPVADRSLGTRHRAAIGLSEETDALVIVVSEETAQVSIAQRGRIERNVSAERLRAALSGVAGTSPVPD
jgi:diadenylate cyclase